MENLKGNIVKKLSSLRAFYVILIAFFVLLSLLFGFLTFSSKLEYNLGINLFTGSIFTALTIFFLNLLFTVREDYEWKTVKGKVYEDIQSELDFLFYGVLFYVKDGSMIQMHLILENQETKNRTIISELERVMGMKELGLNVANVKQLLEDKASLNEFSAVARNLDMIEIKFWRFLPPEITPSLMQIRNCVKALRLLARQHTLLVKNPLLRGGIPEVQAYESTYPISVQAILKKLIEGMHTTFKTCEEKLQQIKRIKQNS